MLLFTLFAFVFFGETGKRFSFCTKFKTYKSVTNFEIFMFVCNVKVNTALPFPKSVLKILFFIIH